MKKYSKKFYVFGLLLIIVLLIMCAITFDVGIKHFSSSAADDENKKNDEYLNLDWDNLPEDFPWDSIPWKDLPEDFPWQKVPWQDAPEDFPWDSVPWQDLPEDFPWQDMEWENLPKDFPWQDMPWEDIPDEDLPENVPWGALPGQGANNPGQINPDFASCEHRFVSQILQQPTCGAYGRKYLTCLKCGFRATELIPPTGEHTYGTWQLVIEATCNLDGKISRFCKICGAEDSQIIPATGDHVYGEWEIINYPTCGKPGSHHRRCRVCGYNDVQDIPATNEHKFGEWSLVNEATCNQQGKSVRRCDRCGYEEYAFTDATGIHKYGDWRTVKEASCGVPGEEARTCEECGAEEKRLIPSTKNHKCDENGFCENCKKTVLKFKSGSASKVYDGTPLSFNAKGTQGIELISGKLQKGHSISSVVYAELVNVGITDNTFKVTVSDEKGNDVTYMYAIDKEYGTLRVEKLKLKITTGTASKKYDATPLKCEKFEYTEGGLAAGDRIEIEYKGWQTYLGRSENLATIKIYNSAGDDVTANYSIELILGTLTVY